MSKLNQAFIKAYGKPPKGVAREPLHVPADTLRDDPAEAEPAAVSGQRKFFIHSAHEQAPAPHVAIHAASATAGMGGSQPAAAERDLLEPTFEVPRFAWPRLIEVMIAAAGSEFAQCIEELLLRRGQQKTLAISGCHRGEGRTTLLVALARLLSTRGLKTALVDADFLSPNLADVLGVVPAVGWEDVFDGQHPLAEALVESVEDRLTLLPLRSPVADLAELAGNHRLPLTLRSLRNHYDVVLVDLGPLTDDAVGVDLAAALGGSKFDSALIVRDVRRTTDRQLRSLNRRLAALGIHEWDLADNFQRLAAAA